MTASKILAHGEGWCRGANELAHLRGTAAALLCVEPTRPDPHAVVVWGGYTAMGSLSRFRHSSSMADAGYRERRSPL